MRFAILLLALTCGALSAPVEDEAIKEFIAGNHQFSTGVYSEMSKYERGSFAFCPISAETVLSLVQEGARGTTAAEFVSGLYLPNTAQKTQYAFKSFLPNLHRSEDNIKFFSANKIYAGEDVELEDKFEDVARSVYYSDIANIDFSKNKQAADSINEWVEEHTNNKIHNLVDPSSFNELTKLVLVNTIYFNGKWIHPFYADNTAAKTFYQSPDVGIEVPTMKQIDRFHYYDHPELKAQFLELPYAGGNISMVIVLPHEGHEISNLEEHLDQVVKPQPYKWQKVDVELPKFKTETKIMFVPILENMGIKKAFTSGADFSGISSNYKKLYVSDVVQKTYISVDENGTEATSATAGSVGTTSLDPSEPVSFKANRPFMYYITYNGVITFFGRVSNLDLNE